MDFGTDGIRSTDIDGLARMGYLMGRAQRGKSKVTLASDNRPTSPRIVRAVAAGLRAAEVDVLYGGVMPTPALQYATRLFTADAGIMVTASHNGPRYNGLKYVDADGRKPTPDEREALVSAMQGESYREEECNPTPLDNLAKAYAERYRTRGPLPLRVGIDCANGAAYPIVKRVMNAVEASATYLHHGDGKQINRDCGALHPEGLCQIEGVDMCFALDGDGDRCVLVTKRGRVVDGDGILYLLAAYHRQKGEPIGPAVVGTTMTNGALAQALSAMDLHLIRVDVGDQNVTNALCAKGLKLGGEPSGHIFMDSDISDGIDTGLRLMQIAAEYDLDDMLEVYRPLPQYHVTVKDTPDALRRAKAAGDKWQDYLAGTGRVVVRASGTEPVVRIMVECLSTSLAKNIGDSIVAAAIK